LAAPETTDDIKTVWGCIKPRRGIETRKSERKQFADCRAGSRDSGGSARRWILPDFHYSTDGGRRRGKHLATRGVTGRLVLARNLPQKKGKRVEWKEHQDDRRRHHDLGTFYRKMCNRRGGELLTSSFQGERELCEYEKMPNMLKAAISESQERY